MGYAPRILRLSGIQRVYPHILCWKREKEVTRKKTAIDNYLCQACFMKGALISTQKSRKKALLKLSFWSFVLHQGLQSQPCVGSRTNATNLNGRSGTDKPFETIQSFSSQKLWRISKFLSLTPDLVVSLFQPLRQTWHQLTANKYSK